MRKLGKLAAGLMAAMMLFTACGADNNSTSTTSDSASTSAQTTEEATTDDGSTEEAAGQEAQGTPSVGGELTIGVIGKPLSLAPWTNNEVATTRVMNIALPALLQNNETAEKVPYIIKEIEQNDTATEYVVTLHEGLSWHDGTPVTSADLEFTARYVPEKKLSYYADMFTNIDRMEIVDDYTVKFILKEAQANFVSQWGTYVPLMPKHVYETVDDPMNYRYDGMGYGPYKLVDYSDGEYYTFERVADWPLANDGQGAYLDRITYRIYADSNALALAMKSGEVQATDRLDDAAIKQLEATPDKYGVLSVDSLGYAWIGFSYKNEILADPAVRTAIAMAVNREDLVNVALQGQAQVMTTPISPVYGDLFEQVEFPKTDIEGAKKVLTDAGYVEKDGKFYDKNGDKPLTFKLAYKNSALNIDQIVAIMQANCASAGITIELDPMDPSLMSDRVTNQRDFDIAFLEWGVIDDVENGYLSTIYHADAQLNIMNRPTGKLDELLDSVTADPTREGRIAKLNDFQREFVQEVPVVDLFVRKQFYGYSKEYAGWELNPGMNGICGVDVLTEVYKVQ